MAYDLSLELGFNFYDLLEKDLLDVVEKWRLSGKIPGALNTTFIARTPKKQKCDTFDNYRPISLCNLIYRIISKRLKGIISGFVMMMMMMKINVHWDPFGLPDLKSRDRD